METGEVEEETADIFSVGLAAMQQPSQAEEEQHHTIEAGTAADSCPYHSQNQQVVAEREEEHKQEVADMPASEMPDASLRRQQAEEEELALSALHAFAQLHGPAELLATEEGRSNVHALLSSVHLQVAAEPGDTDAKQVAADTPYMICPEQEDQRSAGLLHLSLQTPFQPTHTDVLAMDTPAATTAAGLDHMQLFACSANGLAQHAVLLCMSSQHSPSQPSPFHIIAAVSTAAVSKAPVHIALVNRAQSTQPQSVQPILTSMCMWSRHKGPATSRLGLLQQPCQPSAQPRVLQCLQQQK